MYCFTVMHKNTPIANVSDNHNPLSPDALVMVAGSSIGTQKKFYEHGYWYKQNSLGYEGTAEYLSSVVLSCSNIDRYVTYERCTINGCPGCRSANFLAEGETYVSLQRLYDTYHGGQLSERIRLIDRPKERIQYVTRYVQDIIGLDMSEQFSKLLAFDMLILNTDRHFNNIGIIADTKRQIYKNAPVFDNGNALLSNVGIFDFDTPVEDHIEKVVGQPFSASLERQALEAGIGLKLNYHALREKLQKEPASRALDVLWIQLEKYESLLRDDGLSN